MTTKFNSSEKLIFTSSNLKNEKLQRNKKKMFPKTQREQNVCVCVLNLCGTFASHTTCQGFPTEHICLALD